jgi:hypothetical protein
VSAPAHRHVCICGQEFGCADDPDRCELDICDVCEADLYWDARMPDDINDERAGVVRLQIHDLTTQEF